MTNLNITNEELEKLKVLGEYLIFDQYKNVASFPRFEECFGLLFEEYSSESLQKIYKDICGKNHKYISFRRIIKAYLNYKEQNNDYCNETKEFFKKLFTKVEVFFQDIDINIIPPVLIVLIYFFLLISSFMFKNNCYHLQIPLGYI